MVNRYTVLMIRYFAGGINDIIGQILDLCLEQQISVVFAMSRRRLAFVLKKRHKVGCVGIFSYDGAEVRVNTDLASHNLISKHKLDSHQEYTHTHTLRGSLLPHTHVQGIKQSVLSVVICRRHENRQISISRHPSDS